MRPNSTLKKTSYCLSICTLLLLSFSANAQWTPRPDALVTRSEVPSVVYDGKYYTFLGFSNGSLHVDHSSEVFDTVTNTWTMLANIPAGKAVTHQGVALIDHTVWHVGGRAGNHPAPLTNEIWIYDIPTDSWSAGPPILDPANGNPLPWAGGGAALLGRTLHVFGGFVNSACNNDQNAYHLTLDVDEWLANTAAAPKWKNERAPMPLARNHFATVVLAGKIYAIGGQFGHDCGGGSDQRYSHVYNPATNTWAQLPLLPAARSHMEGSTFVMDGKIFVLGGQTTNNVNTNKVTVFDPAANNGVGSWKDDANLTLPTIYEGLAAKFINNLLIISHGGEGASNKPRNTAYTRKYTRKPVNKFGFMPECASLSTGPNNNPTLKPLLFTIDGSKEYVLTSNVPWLSVTKNATGKAIQSAVPVEISINTAGLAPGTYTGFITVTGTGSGPNYTAAQYCVNLTVTEQDLFEAETAQVYGAVIASNHPGYTGAGFADCINAKGDFIEWSVDRSSEGAAFLRFRYANGSSADRPLKLDVNGETIISSLSFPPTGSWSNWATVSIPANLVAGANKIRVTTNGYNGANLDHLQIVTSDTLEAEKALLKGAVVNAAHPGFTGTGYADYVNARYDYVEWTVNQSIAGTIELQFRYANGSTADRPLKLDINGTTIASSLSFPPTGSWSNWNTVSLSANLKAGVNKIRLTAIGYSGGNFDHLVVRPPGATTAQSSVLQANLSRIATETNANLRITVSPNPATGVAKVIWQATTNDPATITLSDATGRIRKSLTVANSNGQYDISVHNLPAGLYLVFLRQGNKQAATRLLVAK